MIHEKKVETKRNFRKLLPNARGDLHDAGSLLIQPSLNPSGYKYGPLLYCLNPSPVPTGNFPFASFLLHKFIDDNAGKLSLSPFLRSSSF